MPRRNHPPVSPFAERASLLSPELAARLATAVNTSTGAGPLADVVGIADALADLLCDTAQRAGDRKLQAASIRLAETVVAAQQELERLQAHEEALDLRPIVSRDLSGQAAELMLALLDDQGRPRPKARKDLAAELWGQGVQPTAAQIREALRTTEAAMPEAFLEEERRREGREEKHLRPREKSERDLRQERFRRLLCTVEKKLLSKSLSPLSAWEIYRPARGLIGLRRRDGRAGK